VLGAWCLVPGAGRLVHEPVAYIAVFFNLEPAGGCRFCNSV
jgi:hypothetical protein